MGTRHLTIVVQDEETKVAQYGQWDGYPEGQGQNILDFLNCANGNRRYSVKDKENKGMQTDIDFEVFRQQVRRCKFLSNEEIDAKWKQLGADGSGWVSMDIADAMEKKYPQFSRNIGSDILKLIYFGEALELQNSIEFVEDSLFCEWAYVIDLDNNVFEVYQGFNHEPLTKEDRFFRDGVFDQKTYEPYDKFYPIRIAASWPLDDLPSYQEFIETFREEYEEAEE